MNIKVLHLPPLAMLLIWLTCSSFRCFVKPFGAQSGSSGFSRLLQMHVICNFCTYYYRFSLVQRNFRFFHDRLSVRFRSSVVMFGSSLVPFVSGLIPVNVLSTFKMQLNHEKIFDWWTLWILIIFLSLILRIQGLNIYVWVYYVLCIDFEYGNALLEFGCFTGSTMSSEMLVLLSTQAQPVLSSQEYVFAWLVACRFELCVCPVWHLDTQDISCSAGRDSSANCPLRKPCETCENLRNEKHNCETLRNLYLRKLAKTRICETLRILRNKRKTAKLVFAKPCETRICETCETRFAKLGETLRNAYCKNRESCENWVALRNYHSNH